MIVKYHYFSIYCSIMRILVDDDEICLISTVQNIFDYCLRASLYNASSHPMKDEAKPREFRNSSSHLLNIRRQHRETEKQQIKNTLRFNTEIKALLKDQDSQMSQKVSPEMLEVLQDWIADEDYESVFEAIINATLQVRETIENHIDPVMIWLLTKSALPSAAIALDRFIRHSEIAAMALFELGMFPTLVEQLIRLWKGSKQQNIYLSCVHEALRRIEFVRKEQLVTVFAPLEELFSRQMQENCENSLTIHAAHSLISLCTPESRFSVEFVVDYLDFFWRTESEGNRTQIFLAGVQVFEIPPYNLSLTVLINLIRILLHGRESVPKRISAQAKSTYVFLAYIFEFFNKHNEKMEAVGTITVDGQKVSLTLHEFLLKYETSIFKDPLLNEEYTNFLLQFCKNAPVECICEVWRGTGLLKLIISSVPGLPTDACFTALQICLTLLKYDQQLTGTSAVGQLMKLYQIKYFIAQLLAVEYPTCTPNVVQACSQLLVILSHGEL